MKSRAPLQEALRNRNVRAFIQMIRHGEGTLGDIGYRTIYGGLHFGSFATHPHIANTATSKGVPITSTAAGAYQFLYRTWFGLVQQYGFPDFSPECQDEGAVALIIGRGALPAILSGQIMDAIIKCNREWASLPGSPYGQPVVTMTEAIQHYKDAGGLMLAESAAAAALPEPAAEPVPAPVAPAVEQEYLAPDIVAPASTPKPEKVMPPFLLAALPSLFEAVPKLISIFGGGTEVAKRNEAAVTMAVNIAKEAAGASNEQALVDALKDPATAATVKQAIEDNWYQLTTNSEGIAEARKASVENTNGFWRQPAFWITVALLPLVYGVVWLALTSSDMPSEVKSMVVATVVSGVLGAITGFWLGTSFSSQRKTELAAGKS